MVVCLITAHDIEWGAEILHEKRQQNNQLEPLQIMTGYLGSLPVKNESRSSLTTYRPSGKLPPILKTPRAISKEKLTLEKILIKSAWLFNRCGYHGTSLLDIARAFGVSKAALYHHVKSKEDIVFGCYQRAMDVGMEGLQQAAAHAVCPDEELAIALRHYIEGVTNELSGAVVLLDDGVLNPAQRSQLIARRDDYERALRGIIERGVSAGVFLPCDSKMVGFAILGAVNWISKWYDPAGARSGKDIAKLFSSYLVRGLQKGPFGVSALDKVEKEQSERLRMTRSTARRLKAV